MAPSMRKRALVLKGFTDAGTGKGYKSGNVVPIDAGAYENYKAAGLVAPAPEELPRPKAAKRRASRAAVNKQPAPPSA